MQAAVGLSAPPLHHAAPGVSLRRPSVPSPPLLRRPGSLTLVLSCPSTSSSSSSQVVSCRCTSSTSGDSTSSNSTTSSSHADWDWATWNRHFSDIDQAESFLSVLKFQLEEAIENEDFSEAAKLKKSIAEAASKDVVAQVMSELKNSIEEQRYHDASRLSRLAGTGLTGWWVGHAKDLHVSFGRIVRITPEVGRYVARSYSPRQLLIKSLGTPLFEIFLLKDDDGKFTMKVVSLQSTKISKPTADNPSSKQETGDSASAEKDDYALPQDSGISEKPDEALQNVVSFFKERISSFKVQMLNDSMSEEKLDMESLQHLIEDEDEDEDEDDVDVDVDVDDDEEEEEEEYNELGQEGQEEEDQENETGDDSEDEIGDLLQDTSEIGPDLDKDSHKVLLYIGRVLHNREDVSNVSYRYFLEHTNPLRSPHLLRRAPAEVRCMEKDSFVLHVPRKGVEGDMLYGDINAQATFGSTLKTSDMVTSLFGTSKGGQKDRKTKGLEELINFSSIENEHRIKNILSEDTIFNRISADTESLDPFTGLYVGSYGPHGPEVVQLRRKYGQWSGSDEVSSGLEFFEYVEAVKLTGDLNVPAGEVTFRAKIGKGNKISNDGIFPEALGVTSFYNGQGRTAQPGYENPEWVQGELLELNGKGMGPIKGAELGFLYLAPVQSFLVLFHRLQLPQ